MASDDNNVVSMATRAAIAPLKGKYKQLTPQQELFAQHRANGLTQLRAYTLAGYTSENELTARSGASKIDKKPHIKARVAALKRDQLLAREGIAGAMAMPDDADTDRANLVSDFNPITYSKEFIARELMRNVELARGMGKIGDSTTGLKLLAEMKGYLAPGTPGRKSQSKTPNKGDERDGSDPRTTVQVQVFNKIVDQLDHAFGDIDQARDITPAAGEDDVGKHLSDQRTRDAVIDLDGLTRAFGTGVPEQTT